MDADPGASVRRLKDSSLVRAAEAVRDGHACAMVSAGNTGAAMAASLLRMGRVRGIARPAIAIPIFTPGHHPTLLLDAGANAECQPEWLVQFAQMGAVYSRLRYGVERPRIGLMSIGEESVKGNSLVKDTHQLMTAADDWLTAAGAAFIGNIEGRDLMKPIVDVAVTDGFTGNVTLKALEGMLAAMIETLRTSVPRSSFDDVHPTLSALDPENTGGGMLLGVRGVSIISHGSSSAHAIVNAIRLAQEMVQADVIGALGALRGAGEGPDADDVADGDGAMRASEHPQPTGIWNKVQSHEPRCSRSCATGWPTSSRSTPPPSTRVTPSATTSTPTPSPSSSWSRRSRRSWASGRSASASRTTTSTT
jgi:glycerol-3-phosphate acyltransferase PlsX